MLLMSNFTLNLRCTRIDRYIVSGIDTMNPNTPQKINNSKYYIFCLEKDTLPTFQPIDTNEINDVAFININNIMGLTINKEVVLMLKRKLNIAKKYAIVLRL